MALLTCENLALGYDGRVILEDLSFSIASGDYLCIVGENGTGKTTLMKALLGLHPPISGSIATDRNFQSREIGYLPQQTQMQKDFPASVREIVLSGFQGKCGLRPFYTRLEKQVAASAMEKMGISDLQKRCYRELSGGQQQRVLLARALCATRKMLLLDEPAAGLDPGATDRLYRLIRELHREGIAIVMITHDPDGVIQYASHVLHIGRSTFFSTREEYLRRRQEEERLQ